MLPFVPESFEMTHAPAYYRAGEILVGDLVETELSHEFIPAVLYLSYLYDFSEEFCCSGL